MEVQAKFTQLTAKQGKTVIQFELDEACSWALPDLATLAGAQVMLDIEDPQGRLPIEDAQQAETLPIGGLLPEQAKVVDAEVEDVEEVA